MKSYNDLIQLKNDLEKSINENQESTIVDILKVLETFPITIHLLKDTKIGFTLVQIKKKFDGETALLSKEIISLYKKICEQETKDKDKNVNHDKKEILIDNIIKKEEVKCSSLIETTTTTSNINITDSPGDSTSSSPRSPRFSSHGRVEIADDDLESTAHFDKLSAVRRKVMDLFTQQLVLSTTNMIGQCLAYNIEDSLNALIDCERDGKAYGAKARNLLFNLKKNEQLRLDLIQGVIPPENLVHLNPNQLATTEKRSERSADAEYASLAARSDLLKVMRDKVLLANGLDPNAAGEFQCRKCKGTKTTHHSLQTRSSDEPMTVFVCCLNCGNRWRCT